MAVVFDIQKFSIHDGPGIRTILFLKGCPLRCEWCANPESQKVAPQLMFFPEKCVGCGKCLDKCPTGAIGMVGQSMTFDRTKCINCGHCTTECYVECRRMSGREMTVEEAIQELEADMIFYKQSGGGITFSGGEPITQPEFVRDVAKHFHEEGVGTAIETCGAVPMENYEKVLPYLDLILFDLKIMDEKEHVLHTGGSNKQILKNIRYVCSKVHTIIRTPIIPGINDSDDNLQKMKKFISSLDGHVTELHILPYHDLGKSKYQALGYEYLLDIQRLDDEYMQDIKRKLEMPGLKVQIGG